MSQESLAWLNANTLIGFTDKRGTAWHYRASEQGRQPNHFPGPVPVQAVRDRLFRWEPVEGTVETTYPGSGGPTRLTDRTRKTIVRPDTGEILGVFKNGFTIHEYKQWLVANVESILDDTLSIGSAGLLRGGALAWVQVEVPDTCTTPEGVAFRPFLSAATSLDGSLSSTYQTGAQLIVCDNTLSAALLERSALRVKVKHSSRSLGRITDVRDALGIIHQVADDFAAEVTALCEAKVSDAQWAAFLDAHTPVPEAEGRSRTLAERKREELNALWNHDQRVAPWQGTAFGVVQAVNTWSHHHQTVRGAHHRAERNMLRAITGGTDDLDQSTLAALHGVLGDAALSAA
jgi:phage/plasmid-like protein (TIGR03299 family)